MQDYAFCLLVFPNVCQSLLPPTGRLQQSLLSHVLPDKNILKWSTSAAGIHFTLCPPCLSPTFFFNFPSVDGSVLQSARSHAKPEGAAGAEDPDDRGQHPAAAGRAASDPGGAAESAGPEPAGETRDESLIPQVQHLYTSLFTDCCRCTVVFIFRCSCRKEPEGWIWARFRWPRAARCSRGQRSACRARWCLLGLCRTAYSNNTRSSPSHSSRRSSEIRTKHSHRSDQLNPSSSFTDIWNLILILRYGDIKEWEEGELSWAM